MEKQFNSPQDQSQDNFSKQIVKSVQLKKTVGYMTRQIAKREKAGIIPQMIAWSKG